MENKEAILSLIRDVRTRIAQLCPEDQIIALEALNRLIGELTPERDIYFSSWK
jgi:hypothetical protein